MANYRPRGYGPGATVARDGRWTGVAQQMRRARVGSPHPRRRVVPNERIGRNDAAQCAEAKVARVGDRAIDEDTGEDTAELAAHQGTVKLTPGKAGAVACEEGFAIVDRRHACERAPGPRASASRRSLLWITQAAQLHPADGARTPRDRCKITPRYLPEHPATAATSPRERGRRWR